MKIKEFKSELKVLASKIRTAKHTFKEGQRANDSTQYKDWCIANDHVYMYGTSKYPKDLSELSYTFRHRHIAYCLLRGKAYEQIENKVTEGNEPNWALIETIMDQFRENPPIEETAI